MKRVFLMILACTLLMSCACAETGVTYEKIMELYRLQFPDIQGNMLIIRNEDGLKSIYDYRSDSYSKEKYYIVVAKGDYFDVEGENGWGYLDENLNVIVPCEYDLLDRVTERWNVGIELEKTDSKENADYVSSKEYYAIAYADVFYRGQKIGRIDGRVQEDFIAYGDYLYVTMHDRTRLVYDTSFNFRKIDTTQEYTEDFTGFHIVHVPTGEYAFEAGCTLSEDEVDRRYYYDADRSVLVDLYGNEIMNLENSYKDVYDFVGEYAIVRKNSGYGLIDSSGREILPCEYNSLELEKSQQFGDGTFASGYQRISKYIDGSCYYGYANRQGEITVPVEYSSQRIQSSSDCFMILKNGEVISAAIGLIPNVKSKSYYLNEYYINTMSCVVEDDEGRLGVIDMYGNVLIPFQKYKDIKLTYDGACCLVEYPSENCELYRLNLPSMESTEEPVEETSTWVCVCGSENESNFCPNCGAKRG